MPTPTDFYFAIHRLLSDVRYTVSIEPETGDKSRSNLYGHLIRRDTGFVFVEDDAKAPDGPLDPKLSKKSTRQAPKKKRR